MGHAGALISNNSERADAKLEAMESAGIIVTKNPARLGITFKQSFRKEFLMFLKIMFLVTVIALSISLYLRY